MPTEAKGGAMRPPIAARVALSPAFRHSDALGCRHESCSNQPFARLNPQFSKGAPRARGDGPKEIDLGDNLGQCSPRTRGWSRAHDSEERAKDVLPAHAGMVP